jgi:hypothetical protein
MTADHNPDALLIDRADLGSKIAAREEQLSLFSPAATAARSAHSGEL